MSKDYRPSPYHAIMNAAANQTGCRLTKEEVAELARDHAIYGARDAIDFNQGDEE